MDDTKYIIISDDTIHMPKDFSLTKKDKKIAEQIIKEVMEESNKFYKEKPTDTIWWVDNDSDGEWLFSFDKKTIFNMFRDYPYALTPEQKAIFDKENPYWADFFKDRQ